MKTPKTVVKHRGTSRPTAKHLRVTVEPTKPMSVVAIAAQMAHQQAAAQAVKDYNKRRYIIGNGVPK